VISASHEPDASTAIAARTVAMAGGRVVADSSQEDALLDALNDDGPDSPIHSGSPVTSGKGPVIVPMRGGPNVA
jgi:hypothetical protein